MMNNEMAKRARHARTARRARTAALAVALAACLAASGALAGCGSSGAGAASASANAGGELGSRAARGAAGDAPANGGGAPAAATVAAATVVASAGGAPYTAGAAAGAAAAATTAAATAAAATASATLAAPLLDMDGAVAIHIGSSVAEKVATGAVSDISSADPLLTAYLHGNSTFVPRSFLEASFGLTFEINDKNGLMRIFGSDGKRLASFNSEQYDVAASYDGVVETYVPLRAIVEKLGKAIHYDRGLIIIGDPAAPGADGAGLSQAEIDALRLSLVGARPVGSAGRLEKLLARGSSEIIFIGAHAEYGIWNSRLSRAYGNRYLNALGDFADDLGGIVFESDSIAIDGAAPQMAATEAAAMAGGAGSAGGAAADGGAMLAPRPAAAPAPDAPMEKLEEAQSSYAALDEGGSGIIYAGGDDGYRYEGYTEPETIASGEGGADAAENEEGGMGGGGDDEFSKTNTQVEGVDESDVVKTDGKYIYYVNGMRILIVEAYPPDAMRVVGRIDYADSGAVSDSLVRDVPVQGGGAAVGTAPPPVAEGGMSRGGAPIKGQQQGERFYPLEIYVDGDRLVVIGSSDRDMSAPRKPAAGGGSGGSDEPEPTTATSTEPATTGATEDPTEPAATEPATTEPATTEPATTAATEPATTAPATTAPATTAPATTAPATTAPATEPSATAQPEPDADADGEANLAVAAIDVAPPLVESWDSYPYYGYMTRQDTTLMLAYDISDRSKPTLVRETEVDGQYKTSRKIGGAVYVVTNKYEYYYGEPRPVEPPIAYRDIVAAQAAAGADAGGAAGNAGAGAQAIVDDGSYTDIGYNDIYYFPGQIKTSYIVIAAIDIEDPSKPAVVEAALDNGDNVYASQDCLYVAATDYSYGRIATDMATTGGAASQSYGSTAIHRFRLKGASVSYDGRGEVPGYILNQFSMDQSGSWFRIATTTEGYDERRGYSSSNNLYVLDDGLKVVGRLEDLAPGERIYSVRFMGARAYVVTFKQVDPLFVIDLSDPRAPRVLGALKIPGYSDYLHPYDDTHLIGFGKDTVETKYYWDDSSETTAFYQGMKIALFDVSDVANPVEMWKTTIGDRGTDSELLRNHKALLFSKERNLLAFPVTVMEFADGGSQSPREAWDYGSFAFQGAYVYNLDLETGFTLRGRVTHLSSDDYLRSGTYGFGWGEDSEKYIDRLLYVKDTLYALSQRYITASDIGTLREAGRLDLR